MSDNTVSEHYWVLRVEKDKFAASINLWFDDGKYGDGYGKIGVEINTIFDPAHAQKFKEVDLHLLKVVQKCYAGAEYIAVKAVYELGTVVTNH